MRDPSLILKILPVSVRVRLGAPIRAQIVARMKLFINHRNYVCIHNAYTLPEGFEGDALILDNSHPRASALEQSSRSICLCHWSMGDPGWLILNVKIYVLVR
jgi:hypothetical protein